MCGAPSLLDADARRAPGDDKDFDVDVRAAAPAPEAPASSGKTEYVQKAEEELARGASPPLPRHVLVSPRGERGSPPLECTAPP